MKDEHESFNLSGLLVETARRKHDAARARNSAFRKDTESPRSVYLDACKTIALSLTPFGFRFAKTGPRASRIVNGVTHRVQFQSDRNNLAGRHVGMLIHAGAENTALEQWLAASAWPFRPSGMLGGGQIGNLVEPHRWWKWQLADRAARPAQITDAIRQVQSIVLPFFARFDDLDRLAHVVRSQRISGIDPESATAIAYWRLGSEAANDAISLLVGGWDESGLARFRAERERVLQGGIPDDIYGDIAKRLGALAATLKIALDV